MASRAKHNPVKKQYQSGKPVQSKDQSKLSKNQQPAESRFPVKLDQWLEPRMNLFFYVSLFFTVLFGAYLFDAKISTGGDDSHYIEMANDFLKGRSFPTWHGPLYPIFLSLPMLIAGVNVVVMKLFSFAFVLAHLVLFYFTFRKLVSPTLFAMVMLIVSVSSSILYFASQTYSEALYMFLQSLTIMIFVNLYKTILLNTRSIKSQIPQWLLLGFFILLASLTRNIGIIILAAMVLFLLIEKKWKESLVLILSFLIFFIPFKLYKSLVWNTDISKGSRPYSEIFLKNSYNPSEGFEDFSGMIVRFFENARLYLSKHFMVGLGLHDPSSTDKSWFVTLVIAGIFVVALYFSFRKRNILLFITIYLGAAVSATFITLQQSWDQMRMVVIYIPMLLLILCWGIQQLAQKKGFRFLAVLLPFLLVFIFFRTLGQTMIKVKANQKVLAKNLSGNPYYGFTPDWKNFLFMSQWVGENIPDTAVVASRKPSMSFIYSKGRDFYGIYRFPSVEPSKLINGLKARSGEMMAIPNAAFEKNIPPALRMVLKQAAVAYVAEGNDIYGLYVTGEPFGSLLRKAQEDYHTALFTVDSLMTRIRVSTQNCFAVSPDTLINTLRKSRVSYVIVASLRANPNMNTGNIINNIQRYLYFVELKYPGILTLVHQIGTEAEEPAWLYRIDYKKYKL